MASNRKNDGESNGSLIKAVFDEDVPAVYQIVKRIDQLELSEVIEAYEIAQDIGNNVLTRMIEKAKKKVEDSKVTDSRNTLMKAVSNGDILAVRKMVKCIDDLDLDEVEAAHEIAKKKGNRALIRMINDARQKIIDKEEVEKKETLITAVYNEDIVEVRKILKNVDVLDLDEVDEAYDIAKENDNKPMMKMISDAKKKIQEKDANQEGLMKMFRTMDVDDSGFITADNLKAILSTLGEDMSDEEIDKMIQGADVKGTGHLDFEEFAALMTKGSG